MVLLCFFFFKQTLLKVSFQLVYKGDPDFQIWSQNLNCKKKWSDVLIFTNLGTLNSSINLLSQSNSPELCSDSQIIKNFKSFIKKVSILKSISIDIALEFLHFFKWIFTILRELEGYELEELVKKNKSIYELRVLELVITNASLH